MIAIISYKKKTSKEERKRKKKEEKTEVNIKNRVKKKGKHDVLRGLVDTIFYFLKNSFHHK